MCLFTNPSEICNHPECASLYTSQAVFPPNNTSLILVLSSLMQQQAYSLSNLIEKSNLLSQKLNHLSQVVENKKIVEKNPTQETFSVANVFRWISCEREFPMFLTLINTAPQEVFKEKGFRLEAMVTDESGKKIVVPDGLSFVVSLFTVENPPKLLKANVAGKKILRGTTEVLVESGGEIVFQNVVINEVTSHYPNDQFCVVVLCPSNGEIKPLVLGGMTVRARKHRN